MSARKTEDTAPDIKSAAGTKAQPKNKKKQAEKGFLGHVMGLANHAEQEGIEHDQVGKTLLGPKTRFELMSRLQAQNPNPKSELNYRNSFELLCAVVLSAQSTDVAVNKASPALFAVAPDAKSMAELGPEGIAPYIQSIGLWKNKAKHLASLAQMLNDEFGGEVPDNDDDFIKLPGVGSKTAKVVLNGQAVHRGRHPRL